MPKDRDFMQLLAKLSYDPFFVIDGHRRVMFYNDAFAAMLGLTARQRRNLEGTPYTKLLELDATGQECLASCLRADDNVQVQSVKAKAPDGREFVLDMSALPIRDDAGAVTGIVVLQRDVTDEQNLREKYDRLRAEQISERESLLRIINDRDAELKRLKNKV